VARVIVFDASVLIAFLDGSDLHHDTAVELLERELDDEFAANPLTLAEVLVGPARAGHAAAALAALHDLEVAEQPFPPETPLRLAELRAATGLRMPDCCVLLAAQEAPARVASFDTRLLSAATQLGLDALTL
jgi:predicted nucleic acid-binding protein